MGNMSYCRFVNTLGDLNDCYDHMEDNDLSEAEEKAKDRLIRLCEEISSSFGEGE